MNNPFLSVSLFSSTMGPQQSKENSLSSSAKLKNQQPSYGQALAKGDLNIHSMLQLLAENTKAQKYGDQEAKKKRKGDKKCKKRVKRERKGKRQRSMTMDGTEIQQPQQKEEEEAESTHQRMEVSSTTATDTLTANCRTPPAQPPVLPRRFRSISCPIHRNRQAPTKSTIAIGSTDVFLDALQSEEEYYTPRSSMSTSDTTQETANNLLPSGLPTPQALEPLPQPSQCFTPDVAPMSILDDCQFPVTPQPTSPMAFYTPESSPVAPSHQRHQNQQAAASHSTNNKGSFCQVHSKYPSYPFYGNPAQVPENHSLESSEEFDPSCFLSLDDHQHHHSNNNNNNNNDHLHQQQHPQCLFPQSTTTTESVHLERLLFDAENHMVDGGFLDINRFDQYEEWHHPSEVLNFFD